MNNKKGKSVARSGILIAILFLVGACSTAPNRNPAANGDDESDVSGLVSTEFKKGVNIEDSDATGGPSVPAMACGQLFYGETSHTALNDEEAFYFLRLRCDSSAGQFVKFDKGSMSPQRRGVLTRYMRQASKVARGKKANPRRSAPIVCFRGEATAKPCEGAKTIIVTEVKNFTTNEDTYKGWTVSK